MTTKTHEFSNAGKTASLRQGARMYLQQRDPDNAIRCLHELNSIESLDADDLNNLGIAHGLQGNWDIAIKAFSNAVKLRPELQDICANLLKSLLIKGELNMALDIIRSKSSNVPYELGSVIMRQYANSREARENIKDNKWLYAFAGILQYLDIKPTEELLTSFIYANTLFPESPWREKALLKTGDDNVNKWVRWEALEEFNAIKDQGRGVILLHSHFTMNRVCTLLLAKKGMVIHSLEFMDRLGDFGVTIPDCLHSIKLDPQSRFYLRQVYQARKALSKGEIVQIAGDGNMGSSIATVRFMGQPQSLKTGFADLALISRAPVVPLYSSVRPSGEIMFRFHPPLDPGNDTIDRQLRVELMLQQYATLMEGWWKSDPGNFSWKHMMNFLRRGYAFIYKP